MSIVGFLLVGLVAGWLAGLLLRGRGFGCLANVLIGALGSLIGGFLFKQLDLEFAGWLGSLLVALVGAVVLIFSVEVLRKLMD